MMKDQSCFAPRLTTCYALRCFCVSCVEDFPKIFLKSRLHRKKLWSDNGERKKRTCLSVDKSHVAIKCNDAALLFFPTGRCVLRIAYCELERMRLKMYVEGLFEC